MTLFNNNFYISPQNILGLVTNRFSKNNFSILKKIKSLLNHNTSKIVQKLKIENNFRSGKVFSPNNCYITCTGKNDGVGAQSLAIISTMLFAKKQGITYLHTPFSKIEHNYSGDPNWEQNWENFLGLGYNELNVTDFRMNDISPVRINDLSEIQPEDKNTLYQVTQCHKYTNPRAKDFAQIQAELLKKYNDSNKAHIYQQLYNHQDINIAIHMRRGDILRSKKDSKRYTTNTNTFQKLNLILSILNELSYEYKIHIFSQGEISDFLELREKISEKHIEFYLNDDLYKTFHGLVSADILLMSKSTLSYTAALFNPNLVIYENFYHRPLEQWFNFSSHIFRKKHKLKYRIKQLVE